VVLDGLSGAAVLLAPVHVCRDHGLSWLREEPYLDRGPMSTVAATDFSVGIREVCCRARSRPGVGGDQGGQVGRKSRRVSRTATSTWRTARCLGTLGSRIQAAGRIGSRPCPVDTLTGSTADVPSRAARSHPTSAAPGNREMPTGPRFGEADSCERTAGSAGARCTSLMCGQPRARKKPGWVASPARRPPVRSGVASRCRRGAGAARSALTP
jgi:hypothetical protein